MGHIAFCSDVTSVHEYVMFVSRVQQLLKFAFKFALIYMTVFLLEVKEDKVKNEYIFY